MVKLIFFFISLKLLQNLKDFDINAEFRLADTLEFGLEKSDSVRAKHLRPVDHSECESYRCSPPLNF